MEKDGSIIKISCETGESFRRYVDMLEEELFPNFDDHPFTDAIKMRHPKRQWAYDEWVKSGKKQFL